MNSLTVAKLQRARKSFAITRRKIPLGACPPVGDLRRCRKGTIWSLEFVLKIPVQLFPFVKPVACFSGTITALFRMNQKGAALVIFAGKAGHSFDGEITYQGVWNMGERTGYVRFKKVKEKSSPLLCHEQLLKAA